MSIQQSFRIISKKDKYLRVEKFLDEMNKVVPWRALEDEISKYYKDGRGGRPSHAPEFDATHSLFAIMA